MPALTIAGHQAHRTRLGNHSKVIEDRAHKVRASGGRADSSPSRLGSGRGVGRRSPLKPASARRKTARREVGLPRRERPPDAARARATQLVSFHCERSESRNRTSRGRNRPHCRALPWTCERPALEARKPSSRRVQDESSIEKRSLHGSFVTFDPLLLRTHRHQAFLKLLQNEGDFTTIRLYQDALISHEYTKLVLVFAIGSACEAILLRHANTFQPLLLRRYRSRCSVRQAWARRRLVQKAIHGRFAVNARRFSAIHIRMCIAESTSWWATALQC